MKPHTLPFHKIDLDMLSRRIADNGSLMSYTDSCGFFLCKKGQVQVAINNQMFTIHQGDVFLYLPATYVYVHSMSPELQGITYKSNMDFVMPIIAEARYSRNVLSIRNNPLVSLSPLQQQQIENLTAALDQRLQLLQQTPNESSRQILMHIISKLGECLIHEIIYHFLSRQTITEDSLDNKDHILQSFVISLMENYKRNREVAYYAQLQCLTPRYFSSIIKEKSGKTPQQWIIQMVINSIKQSLLYTSKSIKELSVEFNFANQSFFGKYFKEYARMSPREFRERHRRREE